MRRADAKPFWREKRDERSHADCDAVVLGIYFVRHEFSRVSVDRPGNPRAWTPAELDLRSVGHRCSASGARAVGLSARSSEQSFRRGDSDSLAACTRMGRTSRSAGARSSAKLAHSFSLSRANLELDVRRGHLFHRGAGSYDHATSKTPQNCEW